MSTDALSWTFRHTPMKGAGYQVHIALADWVSDMYGYRFWANQRKIASKARVSRQTVNKVLDDMEALGLITLLANNQASGKPNEYRFNMPDLPVLWNSGGVASGDTPLVNRGDKGVSTEATRVSTEATTGTQGDTKKEPKDPAATPSALTEAQLDLGVSPGSEKTPRGNPRVHDMTCRVWDAIAVKPTAKHAWVSLYKLLESMIDKDMTDEELEAAASVSPFLTRTAIEGQVRLARKPPRPTNGTNGAGGNLDDKIAAFRNRKRKKPPPGVTNPLDVKETTNGHQ